MRYVNISRNIEGGSTSNFGQDGDRDELPLITLANMCQCFVLCGKVANGLPTNFELNNGPEIHYCGLSPMESFYGVVILGSIPCDGDNLHVTFDGLEWRPKSSFT